MQCPVKLLMPLEMAQQIVNDLLTVLIGAFGLLNIGSSLMRFCPVYRFAGLSTMRAD